ncbi:hypothetical protein [Streptomyces sp. NPDC046909]|uniref:hypothetical protein n=1 Tax=Streptomyces sp. NPDC046909 TaxID=3155617 RepID=UPI00340DB6FD
MTERNATGRAREEPSAVRIALRPGLVGGAVGAVLSGLINYLLVGEPSSAVGNAINHSVSGLISGFTAAFFGLLGHQRKASAAAANADAGHTDGAPARPGRVDTPGASDAVELF